MKSCRSGRSAATFVYRSSQYYFGEENNTLGPGLNPLISGFATLDLRTSYQVNKDIQIYGLINNALDFAARPTARCTRPTRRRTR